MKDERGFTLVETMCTLVVVALMLLLSYELLRAAQVQEQRAEMEYAVSRVAVGHLEAWRGGTSLPSDSKQEEITILGIPVKETTTLVADSETGQLQLTLIYSWKEDNKPYEQKWATSFR
ncbi:MAG TPA: prepilin-type N-terminal cleavage/methylation domain-containing protein [Bacilli bacterium]|nr:prepilin-type N-terminal cleavage/methylation domain-containing protein [Bacilli bacterium]